MIIPLKGDKINISENPFLTQQFVVKGLGKKSCRRTFLFSCRLRHKLMFEVFIFGDKNSSQFLPDANPFFLWNDFLIKSDPPSKTICMGKRVLMELVNQIEPAYWRWCFTIHPQMRSMGISDRWLRRSVTNSFDNKRWSLWRGIK